MMPCSEMTNDNNIFVYFQWTEYGYVGYYNKKTWTGVSVRLEKSDDK